MASFEVFENKEFGKLILLEINEKKFFIGKDIASKLGYADSNRAMNKNVSNENRETVMLSEYSIWSRLKKELGCLEHQGYQSKRVLLTENGVYELIKAAKHPKANKLKKWIKEILKTTDTEVDDNCHTSVILNNAETEIFSCAEFGDLTVLEIDNEPWFVGKEIAEKLGYKDINKAVTMHVEEEDLKTLKYRDSDKMSQAILWKNGDYTNKTLINESGFYSLIGDSKLPSAKKFKHWVTKEVLPSIRKHGAYMTPNALQEAINNPDFTIGLLEALKKEQNEKIEEKNKRIEAENKANVLEQEKENLSNVIAEVTPKVEFTDQVLESTGTVTPTQIGADYGLNAREINLILKEEGIQYKCNGQWIIKAKYKNKGYIDNRTYLNHGHSGVQMLWTQKGRMFIHQILTKRGIKPISEKNKLETENNQIKMNLGE